MSRRVWTYWPLLSAPAEEQMALDSVLIERCSAGELHAGLRLYTMLPPAVTIGRHQKWQSVIDETALEARGWEWSRRVTGGGALLHHREINYAVVLSPAALSQIGAAGFRSVFRMIMSGLTKTLQNLGCSPGQITGPTTGIKDSTDRAHGLCVRSLTRYEISVDGRKAVAAAQLMSAGSCLQHGTIYLKAPEDEDQFWPGHDPSLAGSMSWWDTEELVPPAGASVIGRLESAILCGFADGLNLILEPRPLSAEIRHAVAVCRAQWKTNGYHRRR